MLKMSRLSWAVAIPLLGLAFVLVCPCAAAARGCTAARCHAGIMAIVPPKLPMMQLIRQTGQRHGDPDGCIICHGGNPKAGKKEKAHKSVPRSLSRTTGPKAFYPDPGALDVAANSCGACHVGYVRRVRKSLMATEAGKIQGNFTAWGISRREGVNKAFGNYPVKDSDGPVPAGAAQAYETYMAGVMQAFPRNFPNGLAPLPKPDPEAVETDPALAGITYQRKECQRCHLHTRGRERPGDFRGLGCSACHMPYGVNGLYEGKDPSIPKDASGHIRIHRIQGNRKTAGIPSQTCNACHNRGKRIGVSFLGMMEAPGAGPFDETGEEQAKRHGKHYIPISSDRHHRGGDSGKGLLCQDCHTSMDVHGDGNITTTTLGQVEIECTDCHGTPDKYPWELALGYGDEFGLPPGSEPRGVASLKLFSQQQFGFDYNRQAGFLLSARGNPLGNVVKTAGGEVVVHSAAGHDLKAPLLKTAAQGNTWQSPSGKTAMMDLPRHMARMECYACHSAWAPQCYGCHVKVDYSDPKAMGMDWVDSVDIPGRITEKSSFRRWEDPLLGINGEGRVSPIIPGCQVVFTVKGKNGRVLAANQMPGNASEAASIGQDHIPLALDMAPVQPHTTQARARRCESCHATPKTLGLGLGNGRFSNGRLRDWTQILDRDGVQLTTVGTHWPGSRAFNREELDRIIRARTCLGCHQRVGPHLN